MTDSFKIANLSQNDVNILNAEELRRGFGDKSQTSSLHFNNKLNTNTGNWETFNNIKNLWEIAPTRADEETGDFEMYNKQLNKWVKIPKLIEFDGYKVHLNSMNSIEMLLGKVYSNSYMFNYPIKTVFTIISLIIILLIISLCVYMFVEYKKEKKEVNDKFDEFKKELNENNKKLDTKANII